MWNGIAARIGEDDHRAVAARSSFSEWFAGLFAIPAFRFALPAVAVALIAIVLGVAYWRTTRPPVPESPQLARDNGAPAPKPSEPEQVVVPVNKKTESDAQDKRQLVAMTPK